MIALLRELYRRLEGLQQRFAMRVVLSVLLVAATGAFFGSLINTSASLSSQRLVLIDELAGPGGQPGGEHVVSLAEFGTVNVGTRTYGGAMLAQQARFIFDDDGAVDSPSGLAEILLRDQYPDWAPTWMLERLGTTWMLALVTAGWFLLVVWMGVTLQFALTAGGTLGAWGLAQLTGSDQLAMALLGIGLLTFTFVLLSRAALIVFDRPYGILAVAHTVLKEASRSRISLVFIVLILVMLPLIPLALDPDAPLRFRIQTFISRSLGFTFYLAACLTLVLSCATVAFEIRDRQIWQVVTKPLSRLNYLLGKWLGVVTVNLVILAIAAVSIFTYVQYLREQPVAEGLRGQEDLQAVQDAVLTARVGLTPDYPTLTPEQLESRVDEVIAGTPEYAKLDRVPLYLRREVTNQVREMFSASLRSVPPGAGREIIFSGLEHARDSGSSLTLRYRFHILRDDEHETYPAVFFFNDDTSLAVQRTYVPTVTHVLSVPASLIDENGQLMVTVVNAYEPPPSSPYGSLNWELDGFEILHKVGTFEANFVRSVAIDWIKLAFLAMLGICCSTFLSFPVACLTSFTVFIAGAIAPYLALSLNEYYAPQMSETDWSNVGLVVVWAFKSVIKAIASVIVLALGAFGEARTTPALVEGRLISVGTVLRSVFWIGIVWSGVALAVGYLVMRKRQLAIYSGQG